MFLAFPFITIGSVVSFIIFGSNVVGVIVDYYGCALGNLGIWVACLDRKRTIRFGLCICFGIISAIGLGLPYVLLIYFFQRYPSVCNLSKVWLIVMDPIIAFGGGKDDQSSELSVLSST